MSSQDDIQMLIFTVAEADETITDAKKKLDEALEQKFLFPWTRRKLRSAQYDLKQQEDNLKVAKLYIDSIVRGDPIDI